MRVAPAGLPPGGRALKALKALIPELLLVTIVYIFNSIGIWVRGKRGS
jgi:hypothetical protein